MKNEQTLRELVRTAYATLAKSSSCGCGCTSSGDLAKTLGYSDDDLACLPDGANMGLSCGNPIALSSLVHGETVLDLGSGGGFDVFIAAMKVGKDGFVIGVDMTSEMILKARTNARDFSTKTELHNFEFRLGEIEALPVADSSIDVVISNCVLNLSSQKERVWQEIYRVLKPTGRICISDIVLLNPLPEFLMNSASALSACISGATTIENTLLMARNAGMSNIEVKLQNDYRAVLDSFEDSDNPNNTNENMPIKISEYVRSAVFFGHKSSF